MSITNTFDKNFGVHEGTLTMYMSKKEQNCSNENLAYEIKCENKEIKQAQQYNSDKIECTVEVVAAIAKYLINNDKSLAFSYDGEKYVLRIEKLIEEI